MQLSQKGGGRGKAGKRADASLAIETKGVAEDGALSRDFSFSSRALRTSLLSRRFPGSRAWMILRVTNE